MILLQLVEEDLSRFVDKLLTDCGRSLRLFFLRVYDEIMTTENFACFTFLFICGIIDCTGTETFAKELKLAKFLRELK